MRNPIKFDEDFFYKVEFHIHPVHLDKTIVKLFPTTISIELAEELELFYIPVSDINKKFHFVCQFVDSEYDVQPWEIQIDTYQLLSSGTVRAAAIANPFAYQKVLSNETFGKIQEIFNAN